ncbi:MAG: hypothetical protein Q4B85_13795 [Lachnospiraceae bacterium]|nr:hypothetical protein [Lachnospiraceae bacterium]
MVASGTFSRIPNLPFDEMNDIADALYSGDAFMTDSDGVINLDSIFNNVVIGDRVILGS